MAAGGEDLDRRVLLYNVYEGVWTEGAYPLPYALLHGTVVQYGNTFLVVGGLNTDDDIYESRILQFDPEDASWIVREELLHVARDAAYATLVPDEVVTCSQE